MKYKQNVWKSNIRYSSTALFATGLMLCLLLLSACNPLQKSTNTNQTTSLQGSSIDLSLKDKGDGQLQSFQQWIDLMKQYGGDVTTYQNQHDSDQQALQNASTTATYQTALTTLDNHVNAIKMPALKAEAGQLQQRLKQDVTSWGQQHQYHNAFDNKNYPLGYEYGPDGIGGWVQDDLDTGKNVADYQQAIEDMNMYLYNFQAFKDNSNDTTPYNQVHKSDQELMKHYGKNGKVLVVSLREQAMRVYENGNLVKSFLVTTGRIDKPTPPGAWWVEGKKTKTTFKANVPKSSPSWYPDTPINFAMQFHSNGYFIHDSWWRNDYGPGTNYPHEDSGGDSFSAQGSHGCVNLSKENANWVYDFVQLYTSIIIY